MCQESDSSPLQLDPLEDYTSPISKLEPQKSMSVSVSVKWTVFKPTILVNIVQHIVVQQYNALNMRQRKRVGYVYKHEAVGGGCFTSCSDVHHNVYAPVPLPCSAWWYPVSASPLSEVRGKDSATM